MFRALSDFSGLDANSAEELHLTGISPARLAWQPWRSFIFARPGSCRQGCGILRCSCRPWRAKRVSAAAASNTLRCQISLIDRSQGRLRELFPCQLHVGLSAQTPWLLMDSGLASCTMLKPCPPRRAWLASEGAALTFSFLISLPYTKTQNQLPFQTDHETYNESVIRDRPPPGAQCRRCLGDPG